MSNYSAELRAFIADPENGMLLDATTFRGRDEPRAAFRTGSGRIQRHYITLWELFSKTEPFRRCIEDLAVRAKEIRTTASQWYDTIITCTSTAKHLMVHLHPLVESVDAPLDTHYLGPYPYTDFFYWRLLDFRDRKVLILTDVISSGSLAGNLAAIVQRLGGKPVAVLSVVRLVDDENDANQFNTGSPDQPIGTLSPPHPAVPIYSVTSFCIPALSSDAFDVEKTIKIDPTTILPEEDGADAGPAPMFDVVQMLAQFEDSESLRFGIHESDGTRFTTAIRFPPLLSKFGNQIWDRLKDRFNTANYIATTLNKDDVQFADFVNSRISKNPASPPLVFIPKVDAVSGDFSKYFLTPRSSHLSGHVILLLASIRSAETVTKLVSLLLAQGISRITLICLLNRMGGKTAYFLSRIKKLISGRVAADSEDADFSFDSVYSLTDFDSDDLMGGQQIVEALANDFRVQTRDAGFRALMEQELRYFRAESITGLAFDSYAPKKLESPLTRTLPASDPRSPGKTVTVTTEDALLYVTCCRAVRDKDYSGLIEQIELHSERTTLYKLILLLLTDVSYLRSGKQFEKLRSQLISLVQRSREERLKREQSWDDIRLRTAVTTESNYLFCLALFSYLDQSWSYQRFIADTLSGGLALEEWREYRKNFVAYYGNERIAWTLSLLLHLTETDYRTIEDVDGFPAQMRNVATRLRSLAAVSGDKESPSNTAILNLNGLLKELGEFKQRSLDELIRYLQSHLIKFGGRHNPIFKSLLRAETNLESVLSAGGFWANRARFPEDNTKPGVRRAVEEALYAAGMLEDITQSLRLFLQFHPGGAAASSLPLQERAVRLRKLLLKVRENAVISSDELTAIKDCINVLKNQLTDSKSLVAEALNHYVVSIGETLRNVLPGVRDYLALRGGLWRDQVIPREWDCHYVLVEPLIFQEVLWNLLTNVRHATLFSRKPVIEIAEFKQSDLVETRSYWCIRVTSAKPAIGFWPPKADSTLNKQQLEIRQFGGDLRLREEGQIIIAELKLLSRDELRNVSVREDHP